MLLAATMVDLTTLEGKDTPEKVRSLCQKAANPDPTGLCSGPSNEPMPRVAAVCVYPSMVETARRELERLGAHASQMKGKDRAKGVAVASVATGFPSGQYPLSVRLDDTKRAIEAGADEVDMVISRGAALAGEWSRVADEVAQTKEVCMATMTSSETDGPAYGHAHLKVILETGELDTFDTVRRASDVSMHAGLEAGDFIKTSTGKVNPAATMGVTLVMLEAIRDYYRQTGVRIGMKPAGGIRTSKDALHYLVMLHETLGDAWMTPTLFRFGASSLLNDLQMQLARRERGVYMSPNDFAEA